MFATFTPSDVLYSVTVIYFHPTINHKSIATAASFILLEQTRVVSLVPPFMFLCAESLVNSKTNVLVCMDVDKQMAVVIRTSHT